MEMGGRGYFTINQRSGLESTKAEEGWLCLGLRWGFGAVRSRGLLLNCIGGCDGGSSSL